MTILNLFVIVLKVWRKKSASLCHGMVVCSNDSYTQRAMITSVYFYFWGSSNGCVCSGFLIFM